MSHNITSRDGMFTVREPAWHGLGQVLPEHPTREEAQRIAHNWEPVTEPVFRRVPVFTEDGVQITMKYEPIEGQQAVVRSDDGFTLGVVSDTYETVKNNEMYEIAEAIEGGDREAVMYETGGSLFGGRKVWLLLRLREPITISGDTSATIPYFALQNDHVGGGSFRGQALVTRIVCDNTAQLADVEAHDRGTEFVFRHTKHVGTRIEQAKEALANWRESVSNYARLMEMFSGYTVTKWQVNEFIDTFIPEPPPRMISPIVERNIEEARMQVREILDSPTCYGIKYTAYGLVQAAIEYNQHYRRARSNQTRFKRAYLDRSRITTDAIDIVTELVGA